MHKSKKNWRRAGFAALAAGGLVVGGAAVMNMDGQSIAQENAELLVGTYQPDAVFEAYPDRDDFFEQVEQLQQQAAQAEQQGDHATLMQVQQQFEEARQEIVQQFQDAVEAELPELADEKGLDMVALEVVYSRDEIETQDITDDVIEALGGEPVEFGPDMLGPPPEDAPEQGEQPDEPIFVPEQEQPEQQPEQQQPEQDEDAGWGF